MYAYQSSSSGLMLFILLALAALYIVAWVFTMQIVTKSAEEKGYPELSGKLWFIGLFGLIFTPGIIVAALPDKKVTNRLGANAEDQIQAHLPKL